MGHDPTQSPPTGPPAAPLVSLRGVSREYRLGRDNIVRALCAVDLDIARGERLAVLGKSGSGKSTLMNLVGGLDRPSTGQIIVGGNDITKLSRAQLARYRQHTVGFVFQSFHLQPGSTALDNVALPLVFARVDRRHRRQRAAELLDRVGLGPRMNHRSNELSGGERQRVALARALVTRPKLLLADEPTGNLDSATGRQVMDLLVAINREGTTLVMVTHDADLAETYATRIAEMADGRLLQTRDLAPAISPANADSGPGTTTAHENHGDAE